MDAILTLLTGFAGIAVGWAFLRLFPNPDRRWKWVLFAVAVILGAAVCFLTTYALYDLRLLNLSEPD